MAPPLPLLLPFIIASLSFSHTQLKGYYWQKQHAQTQSRSTASKLSAFSQLSKKEKKTFYFLLLRTYLLHLSCSPSCCHGNAPKMPSHAFRTDCHHLKLRMQPRPNRDFHQIICQEKKGEGRKEKRKKSWNCNQNESIYFLGAISHLDGKLVW